MEYLLSFGQNPPVGAQGGYDGDKLTLNYALDGSSFILEVSPEKVCHRTVGDGLSLEFIGGKRTEGTLRYGGNSAPYPIYCTRLDVTEADGKIRICVAFLDGEAERQIDIVVSRR